MAAPAGGMPLLSGPPPEYSISESACRKCNKEFNILFTRSRKCNHCGYAYCHSCSDYQALMPRSGPDAGYDVVPVCAFCIENLTITAAGKGKLRQIPLAKLKNYADSYDIDVSTVIERDDLIDALVSARGPNGCLPARNEAFYRRYSVPSRPHNRPRGLFTRAMDAMGNDRPASQPPPRQQQAPPPQPRPAQPRARTTSGPSRFARPDLDQQQQQQQQQSQRQQQQYRQPQPQYQTRPAPHAPHSQYVPPPWCPPQFTPASNGARGSTPNRPRATSADASPRVRTPVVPTLDELLEMRSEEVAALSVHALKEVLFHNHVNARLVVEKGELVDKVQTLIAEERRERERHAAEEEAERIAMEEARREMEEARKARDLRKEQERQRREKEDAGHGYEDVAGGEGEEGISQNTDGYHCPMPEYARNSPGTSSSSSTPPSIPSSSSRVSAQSLAARLERTGLCVICQDEEANIAIVDCGHLAMCRACADLVMNSTRECPLCRTRIVTEARLLRIFKT
ncbi:hypothetical protein CERSUDRAFT_116199 [Gelatoporia subvermispora B]|uniref:RING-type domain-containing protein n=1 Tax=Ceriporiopsis subvermispora (strain B) TaxID=914234 RepID=M2PHC9_CERS8|nr:hypothetical protein CERSUDRAFT_116199 [Gelatoporia subvermispora B]